MKKCVALFLTLMCMLSLLAIPAMAAAPSSTTGGMNQAAAPADTDAVISINADQASAESKAAQKAEVEKLAAAESPIAYFTATAAIKDKDGKEVDLAAMLGTEDVKVNELQPITITDYKKGSGDFAVTLTFATAYAKDEPVVVMIGIVTENGVEWIALEGIGTDSTAVEQAGGVAVTIPAEIVEQIQNGTALVAVVSK